MKHSVLLILVGTIILLSGCDKNTEITKLRINLQGLVKDEFGDALDSVECMLTSSAGEYSVLTDETGNFHFTEIAVGAYELTASKTNYVTGTEQLVVTPLSGTVELVLTSASSFLRLSDSLLAVGYTAKSRDIVVESNANWTVTSDASWLKTSVRSDAGNKEVRLTWELFTGDNPRIGNITFSAGSLKRKLKVIQSPPMTLLSFQGIIGNYTNNVQDSIRLTFNQPVSLLSITSSYENCTPEIKHSVRGDVVAFSFPCARLGEEFPFSISVKDADNETFEFQFTVPFYDMKRTIQGIIQDYFITDDNTAIWAVTNFPDRLLRISIEGMAVTNSYDLDFKPIRLRFNAYYDRINIFTHTNACYGCDGNYLLSFNPDNGEITRLRVDPIVGYDHSSYPSIFPIDFQTMKNGLGVLMANDESANQRWRFVDATKEDTMYISETHSSIWYYDISISYDRSKIFMRHPYGNTDVDILEAGDFNIRTFESPVRGSSIFLVPSRKSNRVYIAQAREEFVTDLNGYVSKMSFLAMAAFYHGRDFGYRPGEEETIYSLADGSLLILDYKLGHTVLYTDTNSKLEKIRNTTDGLHMMAIRQVNEETDLFRFKTDVVTANGIPNPATGGGRSKTMETKQGSVWVKD